MVLAILSFQSRVYAEAAESMVNLEAQAIAFLLPINHADVVKYSLAFSLPTNFKIVKPLFETQSSTIIEFMPKGENVDKCQKSSPLTVMLENSFLPINLSNSSKKTLPSKARAIRYGEKIIMVKLLIKVQFLLQNII